MSWILSGISRSLLWLHPGQIEPAELARKGEVNILPFLILGIALLRAGVVCHQPEASILSLGFASPDTFRFQLSTSQLRQALDYDLIAIERFVKMAPACRSLDEEF